MDIDEWVDVHPHMNKQILWEHERHRMIQYSGSIVVGIAIKLQLERQM